MGADKCGSTSIQSFLSRHPRLSTHGGRAKLAYACLHSEGYADPAEIGRLLQKNIAGHVNSLAIDQLRALGPESQAVLSNAIRQQKTDLVFSCEGWLRSLARGDSLDFLLEMMSCHRSRRSLEIVAFVRPPVTWINSAWWQWGAWGLKSSFDSWLQGAIRATFWDRFIAPLSHNPNVSRLVVEPMREDVLDQFRSILAIDADVGADVRANVSLPPEVLLLYQKFRDLRPGPHQVKMDHLMVNVMERADSVYRAAPWVLRQDQVALIIKKTVPHMKRMLTFLDESSRQHVLSDPRWWSADAFADRIVTDPCNAGSAGELQMEHLAHDLMSALERAVRILQGHDLADLYLRAPRPPES